MDDLGTAIDLLEETGTELLQSLGRHTNDLMTSVYIGTPSGMQIEYGYDGLTVDDLSWVARTYDQPSYWGHQRPAGAAAARPGIVKPISELVSLDG